MIELRCIHRHTIEEHPKCFVKGLVKGEWRDEKEWEKLTGKPWYTYPGYRIGYLDIETDGLDADFGTMLSWCIKERGGVTVYSTITRDELFNGIVDKRLVSDLIDAMREYKILVGYNSDWFDIPYIRTKALHYNLEFPEYGEIYTWDLYYTARSKLRLSRKSLANVCDYLNIPGKTNIDKEVWRRAKYGNEKALKQVLSHNVADVVITEKLHDKLSFSRKWLRKSI